MRIWCNSQCISQTFNVNLHATPIAVRHITDFYTVAYTMVTVSYRRILLNGYLLINQDNALLLECRRMYAYIELTVDTAMQVAFIIEQCLQVI